MIQGPSENLFREHRRIEQHGVPRGVVHRSLARLDLWPRIGRIVIVARPLRHAPCRDLPRCLTLEVNESGAGLADDVLHGFPLLLARQRAKLELS